MYTRTIKFIILAFFWSFTCLLVTSNVFANSAFAQKNMFSSRLSGNEEVPPLETPATGYAFFKSDDTEANNMNMTYAIYVNNISAVTSANLHAGKIYENGSMVATLFKSLTPIGELDGKLAEGTFTSANLTGPLSGKRISDLIALMNRGEVYVNVYTEQNPTGEIRGQLSLS